MYVLDSSAIIELLADSLLGKKIVDLVGDEPLSSTVISLIEVMDGIHKKTEPAVHAFFQSVPIFELTLEAAKQCVTLQKNLKESGKPLERADLFIAGICKHKGLSLVTCDKDFLRVDGISVLLIK